MDFVTKFTVFLFALHPMLSEYSVRNAYQEAYKRCKMEGDSLPRAAAIQELVAVWKQLWEWRRR